MNNQDIFNAINDIDERFIGDAGRYLTDDDIFSISPSGEPIKAGQRKKHTALFRIAAPVAAAAVLTAAAGISLKLLGGYNVFDPQYGLDKSVAEGSGQTPPINPSLTGELSPPVYGPDNVRVLLEDITKTEIGGLSCGFAYIGTVSSVNKNQIDYPDFSLDEYDTVKYYTRIRAGEEYGGFTVTEARSVFRRDEKGSGGLALDTSVLKLSGSVRASAYLVREDDGEIRCYIKNGKLPAMNYIGKDNGEYGVLNYYTETKSGFRYGGELPGFEVRLLNGDRLLPENADMREVTLSLSSVLITNIKGECTVTAECEDVLPRVWYDPNEELPIMRELDSADDYDQLVRIISGYETLFADFGVYREAVVSEPMRFDDEVTDGRLEPGMIIALYDADGGLYGAYTYRFDELIAQ